MCSVLEGRKNATREIGLGCELICGKDENVECDENEGQAGWMPDGRNSEVDVEDSEERGALAEADDEQRG